jgi:hypothetical protein
VLPKISYDSCGPREFLNITRPRKSRIIGPTIFYHEKNINQPEHPKFQLEIKRINSYEDWPISMKQTPKELSEAGFFYTGKGDRVICFSCGGGLKNWDESDASWVEHAKWYPKCEYLKLHKGTKFINTVQAQHISLENSILSSSTQIKSSNITIEELLSTEEREPKVNLLCKICFDNEFDTVLVPCGHTICSICLLSIVNCPFCKKSFQSVIKMYVS